MGCLVTLPKMSQSAMSMPEIKCVIEPPRPCQKVVWCSFSQTRTGSMALSPINIGRKTPSAPSDSLAEVKILPRPTTPSSVMTSTSVCRLPSSPSPSCQPPSGVAPTRGIRRMSLIFMGFSCGLGKENLGGG